MFQVFTLDEERDLAEYVITCSKMFHGHSIKSTRKLAWEYAKQNHKDYPETWDKNCEAGVEWFYGLMKRNLNLSIRMPEATSIARATAFNRYNVNMFFDNYESILTRPNVMLEPHRIWNLDETGVKTVQGTSKVLSEKGIKQVGQLTSAERGALVTMCCCVNAVGAALPPAYIFPRVNFRDHMLTGAPNGSLGLATSSGWMNSELFVVVLKHFIKHMNVSPDNPAILVMDNHESHVTLATIDTARENGLIILSFPPHCSHRMQPLDVSTYGPFKRYYNATCTDWMLSHPGRAITIYDIGALSGQAYYRAFVPANITAGFRKTGIYPVNRDVFTDDLLLPSAPTDREEAPFREMPNDGPGEEADDEAPEPNNAPTPGRAGVPQPSTSTVVSTTRSPEDIRPYPKAAPRKENTRRGKSKKSTILTDTPERERAAQQISKKRASKKRERNVQEKKAPRRKLSLEAMAKHGEASKENDSSRTNNEGRKGIETVCATRRTVKGKEKASSKVALAQKRKTPSVEQHSDSDSDEEAWPCLVCCEPFGNSKPGERWVRCTGCKKWAHEACTRGDICYVCHNCDSDADMSD